MTPEEFAAEMKRVLATPYQRIGGVDRERAHQEADELIIVLLRQLGYTEGADLFDKAEKWYS